MRVIIDDQIAIAEK